MTRRHVNTVVIIVLLVAALVVLSGCSRAKSPGPAVPTLVPKETTTVPAAEGMPTPTKQPGQPGSATSVAPTSPVQTPVAPTPTTKPIPVPTVTPVPLPPATGQTTYIVKSGDWLWKIAREKGVTAQAIAAVNPGINVNLLKPGQTLIIPAPGSTTPPTATPGGGTGQVIHVVQQGENLFRIALKYNKSVQAIAVANGISNVNMIYSGQKLIIP